MRPHVPLTLLSALLPLGSLGAKVGEQGVVEPAEHLAPVVAYISEVLSVAAAQCKETLEAKSPRSPVPSLAPSPGPVPSVVRPLLLAAREVVEKGCHWGTLSSGAQSLAQYVVPGSRPSLAREPGPEPAKERQDPTPPVPPPTPQELWRLYRARRWAQLQKMSLLFSGIKTPLAKRCPVGPLMKQVALARMARENQDRTTFLQRQREVVAAMEQKDCQGTLFGAPVQEWQDFLLDNGLWLARLMWQKGRSKEATPIANKAYARSLQWRRWPYVFESQQVVFGQIGYEDMGPVRLAQGLEKALSYWTHNGPLADTARTWLSTRAALAWFQARHYQKAEVLLETTETAMAKFWLLKSALARGKGTENFLDHIGRLDPLGYHELEARRLLKKPLPPPPPPQGAPTWEQVAPLLAGSAYRNQDILAFLALSLVPSGARHTLFWDLVYSQTFATLPPDAWPLTAAYLEGRNRPTQVVRALSSPWLNGLFPMSHPFFRALFPKPFGEQVAKESASCSVGPLELYALMRQESLFDPQAESPGVGALGLLQLMLPTARKTLGDPKLTRAQVLVPETNIRAGACYFKTLKDRYPQGIFYAIGAYNAGEERMDGWVKRRHAKGDHHLFIEMIPFGETRTYVQKVLRNLAIYEWLTGEGLEKPGT